MNIISAYIDPATTSYVIQIAAGIIIAAGAGIGIFWNKLGRIFRKKQESGDERTPAPTEANKSEKNIITAEDLLDGDDE